jgi:hypothetical protein
MPPNIEDPIDSSGNSVEDSGRNSLGSQGRTALLVVTALVVIYSAVTTITAGLVTRPRQQTERLLPLTTSKKVDGILASYRKDGIRFTDPQEDALRRLLGRWESREDLYSYFSSTTGGVDIARLMEWARADNDPDALALVLLRPDLNEAAARLGIMVPEGEIISVLVQHLAMREVPSIDGGGSLWILRGVWMRRPDIAERFTVDGRVAVKPLLEWASTAPTNDPDHAVLGPIALNLQIILADLKRQTKD